MKISEKTTYEILEVLSGCESRSVDRPWNQAETRPNQYVSGCQDESSQDRLCKTLVESFNSMGIRTNEIIDNKSVPLIYVTASRSKPTNDKNRFRIILENKLIDELDQEILLKHVLAKEKEAESLSLRPDGGSGLAEYKWQIRSSKCSCDHFEYFRL